jgi:hypothetical protein
MKELTIVFFCSWKFALTFPVAVYGMKFSFFKTLIYTNLGGIAGILFFTYLSDILINLWLRYIKSKNYNFHKPDKPIFTKRRRRFIQIKTKYGFPGIVILNPIILSIPISSFLVVKYYGKRLKNVLWLFVGQISWSVFYTIFYFFIYEKTNWTFLN